MTSPVRGPKFDDSGGGGDVIRGEEGVGGNLQQLQVSYAGASRLVTETMLSMIFRQNCDISRQSVGVPTQTH